MDEKQTTRFLVGGFFLVLFLPIWFWGQMFGWDFSQLSLRLIFPLLGMLAFSIMWTQIVVGTFAKKLEKYVVLDIFFARSGLAVLILFLSHPLLAAYAQWKDLGLLPLESLFALVPESHKVYLILAMIAFVTFVLYEVVMRLSRIPRVKKMRPIFEWLSTIGVFLVWIHSLNLGSHLQFGLMRWLWWFYGISALLMVGMQIKAKMKK